MAAMNADLKTAQGHALDAALALDDALRQVATLPPGQREQLETALGDAKHRINGVVTFLAYGAMTQLPPQQPPQLGQQQRAPRRALGVGQVVLLPFALILVVVAEALEGAGLLFRLLLQLLLQLRDASLLLLATAFQRVELPQRKDDANQPTADLQNQGSRHERAPSSVRRGQTRKQA